jgi:hypothetical protein
MIHRNPSSLIGNPDPEGGVVLFSKLPSRGEAKGGM